MNVKDNDGRKRYESELVDEVQNKAESFGYMLLQDNQIIWFKAWVSSQGFHPRGFHTRGFDPTSIDH